MTVLNMHTHHIPTINVLRFAADKQSNSNIIYDKLSIIMISMMVFNKYTNQVMYCRHAIKRATLCSRQTML